MGRRSTEPREVTDLEVVEDFSATARCDEGFLRLKRLRCQNRRVDGSVSPVFRVDVVDRPSLDAVAVLLYRQSEGALEILTHKTLRPAAYFRRGHPNAPPEELAPLFVEELVAGLLEAGDRGELGVRARAVAEALEEAGITLELEAVRVLGGPFFLAPGILSEKIYACVADCTGKPMAEPKGDGSPLEEGGSVRWWKADALLAACRSGEIQDAKTELVLARFLSGMS